MSYPSYNAATALAASTAVTYPRNKGVMLLNDGSGAGTAVLNLTTPGGTQGAAVTIRVPDDNVPVFIPIRIFSTGALSKVAVYELT